MTSSFIYKGGILTSCFLVNSIGFDLIESVQYESARIVTGLRKGTSRDKLYGELGWDSLQNRRKKQQLILMFKALEGELPNYITNNIISYINIEPNFL
jgi:hypothetical protein